MIRGPLSWMFMTDGSRVVHFCDPWFYRRARLWPMAPHLSACMTEDSTYVHRELPIVLDLCSVQPMVLQFCIVPDWWLCSFSLYMTDGSTVLHGVWLLVLQLCIVPDRWFYSFSLYITDGSRVLHGVWPLGLQFCIVPDRWLCSFSLYMTDGSTVLHGVWPLVLQLCMVNDREFYSFECCMKFCLLILNHFALLI